MTGCFVGNASSNHRNKTNEYNERNNISNHQQQSNNNWEHIEKHLSMKKTIRKKMMRDLQQAFIDGQEPPDAAQKWDNVQLDAHKAGIEPNLLDMLKEKKTEQQPVQSNPPPKKPGFWKKLTMRKSSSSSKRWFHSYSYLKTCNHPPLKEKRKKKREI